MWKHSFTSKMYLLLLLGSLALLAASLLHGSSTEDDCRGSLSVLLLLQHSAKTNKQKRMLHELLGPPNMSHLMLSLQWNSIHLARWVRDSVTFLPVKALTSENMTFFSYTGYLHTNMSQKGKTLNDAVFEWLKTETHKDDKKLHQPVTANQTLLTSDPGVNRLTKAKRSAALHDTSLSLSMSILLPSRRMGTPSPAASCDQNKKL